MNEISEIYGSIKRLAETIVLKCSERGLKVTAAESCTGGMISAAITSVSGSSSVIEAGVCSYSNRIKREVLGVSARTLDELTEYSEQCAEEMARGALNLSGADFAVSTSGVAGPTGGTEENPVGTVYFGVCGKDNDYTITERHVFRNSGRDGIRAEATEQALVLLLEVINKI